MSPAQSAQQRKTSRLFGSATPRPASSSAFAPNLPNVTPPDESMRTAIVAENLSTIADIEQPPNKAQVCPLTELESE
jgi:hypothetical protein